MKLSPHAIKELSSLLGADHVRTDALSLSLYSYDCSLSATRPDGVLLLDKAAQVAPVLRLLHHYKIPFVPRAGATNHAGSCCALKGGVILNLTALNNILEINTQAGFAVVEPGVITADLQAALAPLGYFYAPDPASAQACTIGGNLAQNASGARCLKYGGTLDHVLSAQVVLPDGTQTTLSRQTPGPDFVGLFAGSEGTLGVITQLTVQILPLATHIQTFLVTFPSLSESIQAVSALVARGVIPRCIEAMDKTTLQAVEGFAHAGYPTQAEALLILELDGTPAQTKKDAAVLTQVCLQFHAQHFTSAKTDEERAQLWRGRRSAYAAMARLSPNVMVGDGTVPRDQLPTALARVQKILKDYPLQASLLFHAGDGNFHPHILFDQRNKLQTRSAAHVLHEILKTCVSCGGTISGEHGIGVEKRAVMATQYEEDTLSLFQKIKRTLDPQNLSNPLKIVPQNFKEKAKPALALPPEISALQTQLLAWQQAKTPFIIAGSNTHLKTKHPAVLCTQTLNQIIEIDTANYTVTAQAGVTLSALHTALKKAGVYTILPEDKGTLGGLFCGGTLPPFYSHVLGVEALLPDGSYVRYGGKLMKNAAGYPLTRLFAGSQGTLGLVTQLTFKVFARKQPTVKPHPFHKAEITDFWALFTRALGGGLV